MAADFRIEWSPTAIGELLTSSAAQSLIRGHAERIAAAAGAGFEVESPTPYKRARAQVYTATYEAKLASAKTNALVRAL